MKMMFLAVLLVPYFAVAQSVDIKNVDATNSDETTTTVEIRKGKTEKDKSGALWEVHEGTTDIEGDEVLAVKEAQSSWKKECAAWKKEFREDNKENKIISMSCGSSSCTGGPAAKKCVSKASYKIKTKLN